MDSQLDFTPPPAPPAPVDAQQRRQVPRWAHLAAVVLGVGPLYGLVFYSGLNATQESYRISTAGLLANVAMMLSFGVFLIVLLRLLGEHVSALQLQRGTLVSDIAQGVGLFFIVLGSLFALRIAMVALETAGLLPKESGIPDSNLELVGSVARNPWLLALFLGPVIWLQAAVVEELTRAFVLTRLWKVWPERSARLASVFVWSLFFGLAHIYQGAVGVVGTALIGLVLGLFYFHRGRLLPLMVAHGLYDTLATAVLLYALHHPELMPPALL